LYCATRGVYGMIKPLVFSYLGAVRWFALFMII